MYFCIMKKEELEILCCKTCDIAIEVAKFIKEQAGTLHQEDIEMKAFNNLVSYVDKTAEKMIIERLGTLIPNAAFLAEEDSVHDTVADYRWVIDPLDGTTNFIHQLPFYAISIALEEKGELVLGVILEVKSGDLFYAWKDGGAWLNAKPIKVSASKELSECLVATGFPYYNYNSLDAYLRCFRSFMLTTRGLRRIGSAALDLAYVACGRFDFFFEYSLQKWDVAAGIVLVKEAGGIVTDLTGTDQYYNNGCIIASNRGVFDKALEVIKPEFLED